MDLELHQLDRSHEGLRLRRREREQALLASLADQGQQVPIVVVALAPPQRYLVIDGFKRLRALERLGEDTVRAVVWDLDEAEALILDRSQRMAERLTELEQGWLLAELRSGQGLSLEDLARRFSKSPSWVSRHLALVQDLPEAVQEHVRRGRIPPQAAMRSLVPLARQSRQDCVRLAQAIARANHVLRHDPLREHVHRQLMRCHYAMGNRPAAIRQFQRCVEILDRELDVPPMAETRVLFNRILEGRWQDPCGSGARPVQFPSRDDPGTPLGRP